MGRQGEGGVSFAYLGVGGQRLVGFWLGVAGEEGGRDGWCRQREGQGRKVRRRG